MVDFSVQIINRSGKMKFFISIIFGCFILTLAANAETRIVVDPLLTGMAIEAKAAILKNDNAYFLKYVAEEGIVFAGNSYSKEKIQSLLNDNHSWLYKHLYSGKSSIKHFFDAAKDSNVTISQRSSNAVAIIYSSKNSKRIIQNCYIKISGVWYLEGIFSCE